MATRRARGVIALGLALALGGCALVGVPEPQMIFGATKAGQTDAEFEQARRECNAERALLVGQFRDEYQACMETKGWTRVYHQ
jgi:hypothetical protein